MRPIEPSVLSLEIGPLLIMKLSLSSARAEPLVRTAIEPVDSTVTLPEAVVASAVVEALLTVTSARAAMGSAARRPAAAAESIKRCLIKTKTSYFSPAGDQKSQASGLFAAPPGPVGAVLAGP